MVHRLVTKGGFEFVRSVPDPKGGITVQKIAGRSNQLRGMLGFIDGVDLYNEALSKEGKKALSKESTKETDQDTLSTKELTYRRFLLFTEFYAASRPVLICEGNTDNVYLVHAIRSLAAAYPQLATIHPDETVTLNVRIFKYSGGGAGRILGIHGGSGDLCKLLWMYHNEKQRFKAPGLVHPVVFVIDNDSGATSIFNAVEKLTGTKPKGTENFLHVTGNLYVVPTPISPPAKKSTIEDSFDAAVKATIVDGKKFNPANKIDAAKHYGKMVFAHKVVRERADKIDFTGFKPLLTYVVAVIDEHAKKVAAAAAVGGGP